LVLNAINVTWC